VIACRVIVLFVLHGSGAGDPVRPLAVLLAYRTLSDEEKTRDQCGVMVSLEQFEELRLKLVAYESQQAVGQAEMQQEVKNQVSEVTDGLKELYTTASIAVGAVAARVERIEERIRGGADRQKSLLHHKNMTVSVLEKMDQWRSWTADVEDYTEETMPGIRSDLDKAKSEEEEVSEVDMDPEAWALREMLWRFLKRYTAGEARKVVTSAPNRNGWEAWRKLRLQF